MIKEYQTGVQDIVFNIILQSKKMKFGYITKQQILNEVKKQMTELKNPSAQVSQALYQLQQSGKYKFPKIKKKYNSKGIKLGWTLSDDCKS